MTLNQKLKVVEDKVEELFATPFPVGACGEDFTMNDLSYHFNWDKRSRRKLGCCNYTFRRITLSVKYIELNFDDNFHLIEDTIRHEMAHAFSYYIHGNKGKGHNAYWRAMCRIVGADPTRTKSGINMEYKYTLECPSDNCDVTEGFQRRPSVVRACGKCCREHNGGRFSHKYQMELKQNW
jgi:predicted SprT family Zn-dependent metalloprotease